MNIPQGVGETEKDYSIRVQQFPLGTGRKLGGLGRVLGELELLGCEVGGEEGGEGEGEDRVGNGEDGEQGGEKL